MISSDWVGAPSLCLALAVAGDCMLFQVFSFSLYCPISLWILERYISLCVLIYLAKLEMASIYLSQIISFFHISGVFGFFQKQGTVTRLFSLEQG